ncbi:MAG: TIM barrel protein [Bacteroidetes bacterium]|jgi:sugar phosphate isomerase/epimerase|nr:TIM barrel protein [Bacteroidota bacterium]
MYVNKVLFIKNLLILILLSNVTFSQPKVSENTNNINTGVINSDYKISLAQWSLHKSIYGPRKSSEWFHKMLNESPDSLYNGSIDPMQFPEVAVDLGIYAIELVNTFYFDKADNISYLTKFKRKCDSLNVQVLLIMCDNLGQLGQENAKKRKQAVKNHYKWIDAAKFLGAHSIRVNLNGNGSAEKVAANSVKSLKKLGKYGQSKGINVVVENHGGFSSIGSWLADVMEKVDMKNVGTLPDFGNFCIKWGPEGCQKNYDKYKGMKEIMPYAKGVSAKSRAFDENGNEVTIDYYRMMKIVKDSGYKGYIGIEYEGNNEQSEIDGIKATKKLLEKAIKAL